SCCPPRLERGDLHFPGWHKPRNNLAIAECEDIRPAPSRSLISWLRGSFLASLVGSCPGVARGKRRSRVHVPCRLTGGGCGVHPLRQLACRLLGLVANRLCQRRE